MTGPTTGPGAGPPTSGVAVRRLRDEDRAAWDLLWQGYLAFYEHPLEDRITDATWRRLVDRDESVWGLAATTDRGALVGICHLVLHPSTWSTAPYCYLEDLFVAPDRRRIGVGEALVAAARREAVDAGASKLYWQTHRTNATARRLYDRVAAHRGFVVYEVDLPTG